ncbi:MAG TPA: phosphoethanolamine--lipid A transferase [Rhodocyclaceae bacterium]|nr:phosphoethanolamine--lipid A transferase [Rhodocyclaceae bacterium]
MPANGLSSNTLILLVALFLVAGGNLTFFAALLKTYPLAGPQALYLGSVVVALVAINTLILALVGFGRMTKPILIFMLLLSSLAAYFMDSYGIVLSDEMLQNAVQTNAAETLDLVTGKLFVYFILLGLLPAITIARIPVRWRGWRLELLSRAGLIVVAVVIVAIVVMSFSGFYASFLRQHKSLRGYANPGYFIYSAFKYANQALETKSGQALAVIGADARIPSTDLGRELIILVVGETARADRFSINGYERDTTPQLRAAKAVSFGNYWACGTSTAISVPCMFSMSGMDKFDLKIAGTQENLLDVLVHAGVNVLWMDNNSDSKGVAIRVPYQSFKSPERNPLCDGECRDEGMLVQLQDYIDSHPKGDIFIVLHQMGNHGPAYFKRYPSEFEKFRPVCQSNDLSRCSDEEIGNAYDNAILYTDYFLGKTIELLKRNDHNFETALFYLSDHGESLGEKGIYLHGLPKAIAPDSQTHVPAVIWLGSGFDDVDIPALMKKRDGRFTHDNMAHTVLGLMEIKTKVYRPELDLLDGCRKPE